MSEYSEIGIRFGREGTVSVDEAEEEGEGEVLFGPVMPLRFRLLHPVITDIPAQPKPVAFVRKPRRDGSPIRSMNQAVNDT